MFLLMLASAMAGDAEDLATSIGLDSADIASATLSATAGSYEVSAGLGTIVPQEGSDFAWLYTGTVGMNPQPGTDLGPYGTSGDETTLLLELTAPATANSLAFDFFFLSAEYPEYVGSMYNDSFEANVSGTAWSGNAAIDSAGNVISINSVLFTVVAPADLAGTGFESAGGGTGWLTVVVPVDPGDTIELDLSVFDVSDGIYDSAVAIDDFYWSESDIEEPVIIEEITLDFLSPKRGDIAGGVATTIIGEKFNSSCVAYFDGIETPTTYVDEESLIATPPAHDPGLVDVTVKCVGVEETLGGGYTYFDTDAGELPPEITGITPYRIALEGGVTVQVRGHDFQAGAQIYLEGVEVDTIMLTTELLEFTAPPHAEGLVDIAVVNPDGLDDVRVGALLYAEDPVWPPVDTGIDDTDPADDDGVIPPGDVGGCNTVPGLAWTWGLVLLALRRRS